MNDDELDVEWTPPWEQWKQYPEEGMFIFKRRVGLTIMEGNFTVIAESEQAAHDTARIHEYLMALINTGHDIPVGVG